MVQNLALKALLDDPKLGKKADYDKALDAIIDIKAIIENDKPDGNGAKEFREAILKQKQFWTAATLDIQDTDDQTNDDFLKSEGEGQQKDENNFTTLRQLAAEKRVILALNADKEDLLTEIIKARDASGVRYQLANHADTTIFGNLGSLIKPDTNNADLISDEAANRIRLEAQRLFLIKKIAACPDEAKLEVLINTPDDVSAEAISGLKNTDATVIGHETVKQAAAKIGAALRVVSSLFQLDLADTGTLATLNKNEAGFKADLPAPYKVNLSDDDVPEIKGILGARYLKAKFAVLGEDNALALEQIASAPDVGTCEAAIQLVCDTTQFKAAVTEKTLPELRLAAATQALKLKIDECRDDAALMSLLSISPKDIATRLATHASLGFAENADFRNAFASANDATVKEIAIAAHIRKSLLTTNDSTYLKSLIKDGTCVADYLAKVTSVTTKKAVSDYLAVPHHQFKLREQALISFIKLQIEAIPTPQLKVLADFDDQAKMNTALSNILSDGSADNLVAYNGKLANTLKAYAKAEGLVREYKTLNLGDQANFNQLIASLNALNNDPQIKLLIPAERTELSEKLVKILIDGYPLAFTNASPVPDLKPMALAATDEEFKKQLIALGITNHTWVNETSRQAIQKQACEKLLDLEIQKSSMFGLAERPQLKALLDSLSVEKQQKILQTPGVLHAVMQAKNVADLRNTLDLKVFKTNPDDLFKENKRLASLGRIANAAVAKALSQLAVTLTKEQVDKINADLLDAGNNILNLPNYMGAHDNQINPYNNNFLAKMQNSLNLPQADIYNAFGLNDSGNQWSVDDTTKQAILAQQEHNEELLKHLYTLSNHDASGRKVIELLMRLEKNGLVQNADIAPPSAFLNSIKTAANHEKIIEAIRTQVGFATLLSPGWETQITPEFFSELGAAKKRESFDAPVSTPVKAALKSQKERTDKLKETFAEIYDVTRDGDHGFLPELRRVSEYTAMDWLSPVFQASAKEKAEELGPKFDKLASVAESVIRQLRHQESAYEEELASLPAQGTYPLDDDKIATRRNELTNDLEKVRDVLHPYLQASKKLHGDPAAPEGSYENEGIIKQLEKAKALDKSQTHAPSFEPVFNSVFTDYTKSAYQANKKNSDKKIQPDKVGLTSKSASRAVYLDKPLAAGSIREITTGTFGPNNQAYEGTFTMEYGEEHLEPKTHDGKTAYLPSLKLEIVTFPKDEKARVKLTMEMAVQFLSAFDPNHPPTKKHPFYIPGTDVEQKKYLWTAVMTIIEANPALKINPDAIVVTGFDPNSEKSRYLGFKKESLYKTVFKKDPDLEAYIGAFKSFTAMGQPKEQKNITKDMRTFLDRTREGSRGGDMLKKVEEENKPLPPSPSIR